MHITIVDTINNTVVWDSTVTSPENISFSASPGTYKVFVQGRRSTYEYGDDGVYVVASGDNTIIPLNANTDENPDVWADAPWRVEASATEIPILIVVKDADTRNWQGVLNDFKVDKIHVYLDNNHDECGWCWGDTLLKTFDNSNTVGLPKLVTDLKYNMYENGDWYIVVNLPKSGLSGTAYLHVKIEDTRLFEWDVHSHLRVQIASDNLPSLPNWYAGDTHYHSMYSDNVLEMGAPISATVEAGTSMGLDWVTITDHSFDLDDVRSGASSNDKWDALKEDVRQYYIDPFKLILGEEVSAGSSDGNNIHFLVYGLSPYGRDSFIPGDGDDLWDHKEIPPCAQCTPSLTLSQVIDRIPSNGVGYAAHPAGEEDADVLTWLNRGNWTSTDFNTPGYQGLEIWNTYSYGSRWGSDDLHKGWKEGLDAGIEEWKKLLKGSLTTGRKVFIAGGSDAHGDFNYQTTLIPGLSWSWPPVYDVQYSENAFGKVRTYVYTNDFSQNGILEALKNGHSIMTNGPLITFTINGEIIGNTVTVPSSTVPVLNLGWKSTSEFGKVTNIKIWRGENTGETLVFNGDPTTSLRLISKIGDYYAGSATFTELFGVTQARYYRIEARSSIDTPYGLVEKYRAYTNPIWVEVTPGDTTPPSTPSLLSPSNGYKTTDPRPAFDWTDSADDSGIAGYNIEITGPTPISQFVTASSFTHSSDLADGSYTWRVQAWDNVGNQGSWTTSWSFTVDTAPPSVTLNSPNGGESWQAGTSHSITWSASDNIGVSSIDLKYSTDGGSRYTIATGLADSGSYPWIIPENPTTNAKIKVVAWDDVGYSGNDVSNGVFEITPSACVDTTPPPTPTLTYPPPGSTDDDGTYTVTWTSVTDTGCAQSVYYELHESENSNFPTMETNYYKTTSTSLEMNNPNGKYYYQVRAFDGFDNWNYDFSNLGDITVNIPPPPTPPPPSPDWAMIDDFVDETGTLYDAEEYWGDWYYEEYGLGNDYVQKVSSYEGQSHVGRFYWETTHGDDARQYLEKTNPSGWDFSYSDGEFSILFNNKGSGNEYIYLYFTDGDAQATATATSYKNAGWELFEWERSGISSLAAGVNISSLSMEDRLKTTVDENGRTIGLIYAESNINWADVRKVRIEVQKMMSGTQTRNLYFDDIAFNTDAYLESSKYTVTPGESYTLTLHAQNINDYPNQMIFFLDGSSKVYNNVEAYGTRSFSVTRSKSDPGDYTYTGRVVIQDGSMIDLYSNPVTITVLDTVPPSVSITSPTDGAVIGSSSVAMTWTGDDDPGIDHYEVQIDSGGWINKGITTSHTFNGVGDGWHTIYVKAVDSANNIATDSSNIQVDTTPLEAPIPTATPSGWSTTNSFTVDWTDPADASGIAGAYYKLDSPPTSNEDGTWTTQKPITGITVTGDGAHEFYLWLKDNAGNVDYNNYGSTTLYYDATPPTGSITLSGGASYTSSTSVLLSLSYSDAASGVSQVRYSNDGIWDTETWEAPSTTKLWDLTTGDGEKTAYYQINDNAGLTSLTYSDTIILDTTPPSVANVSHSPINPTDQENITLQTGVSDDNSIGSVEVKYTTDDWNTSTTKEMSTTLPGSTYSPGTYENGKRRGRINKTSKPKKVVVKYRKGKRPSKEYLKSQGGTEIKEIKRIDSVVLEVDDTTSFIRELKKNPDVLSVEEAVLYQALLMPDDTHYPEQWNMQNINTEEGWEHALGDNVTVAVIDTGVDYTHEDLDDNVILGYDWVNDDSDPMDDHGHGTHVAGIVAAEMNGIGVVGVAPNSRILAEKVLGADGSGYDFDVANAIIDAADAGADIISLSLGGSYSRVIEDASNYAYGKGVLIVAAAGNNGGSVLYPAALDNVIAVSALNSDNTLAYYSSRGTEIEMSAPGGGDKLIYSTYPGSTYQGATGTSMAAPHVSGAAALIKSIHPAWSNDEVREHLHSTATDLGPQGKDDYYGHGLVDTSKVGEEKPGEGNTTDDNTVLTPSITWASKNSTGVEIKLTTKAGIANIHLKDGIVGGYMITNVQTDKGKVDLTEKNDSLTEIDWKIGHMKENETHTLTFEVKGKGCIDTGAFVEGIIKGEKYTSTEAQILCSTGGSTTYQETGTYYADIGKFPGGTTVEYYIVTYDTAGNVNSTSDDIKSVYVTFPDTTPPTITIASPENTTYATDSVDLNYMIDETPDWVGYSLDGNPNVTLIENTTLTGLSDGQHSVTVYANDTTGNTGSSTVWFTSDTTSPTVTPPSDITAEATSSSGAAVTYSGETAMDLVDGAIVPSCLPASGSTFPLGANIVTCTATDSAGNIGSGTFTITVEDTTSPSITAPADVTAEATGSLTPVSLGSPTVSDLVDPSSTVTNDAPATYPVGSTTVIWTATDSHGNSATATQTVTVVDTTAPVVTAPADVSVEATGSQTLASIGSATATDAVGVVSLTNDAPADYPVGDTVVTWTAADAAGNSATATQTVTVVDTTAPVVTVSLTPGILWPPNHKMVDITAIVSVSDIADPSPTLNLISIVSSEPDNAPGNGDGNTVNDIQGAEFETEDNAFQLRAERDGNGNGRTYTIIYTVTDASGNTATEVVTVSVPHDQSKKGNK